MRHDFAHSNSRDRASAVRKCAKDTTCQFQRPAAPGLAQPQNAGSFQTDKARSRWHRASTFATLAPRAAAWAVEQRRLLPVIDFAGTAKQKILDVGCGTGQPDLWRAQSPTDPRDRRDRLFAPRIVGSRLAAEPATRSRPPQLRSWAVDPFISVPEADKAIAECDASCERAASSPRRSGIISADCRPCASRSHARGLERRRASPEGTVIASSR